MGDRNETLQVKGVHEFGYAGENQPHSKNERQGKCRKPPIAKNEQRQQHRQNSVQQEPS